jgi:hypothetical protein
VSSILLLVIEASHRIQYFVCARVEKMVESQIFKNNK